MFFCFAPSFKAYKSLKLSLLSTIFSQNLLNIGTILREKEGTDDFNLLSGKNDATTLSGLLATNNLNFWMLLMVFSESLVYCHECKLWVMYNV